MPDIVSTEGHFRPSRPHSISSTMSAAFTLPFPHLTALTFSTPSHRRPPNPPSSLISRARTFIRSLRPLSILPASPHPPGRYIHLSAAAGPPFNSPLPDASAPPVPPPAPPPSPPDVTRILMLISDTGGGHRASASALRAAFEELYPSLVDVRIVDFWTETVGAPFDKLPESYAVMAKYPPLWRCAWNYGKFPLTRRLTDEVTNIVGNSNFRRALDHFQPHIVVSVHPLTQFIPLRVLRALPRKIPFVTVCTDLGGAHPTWFHPSADLAFVPTDTVADIALRCGLAPRQLRRYGLPVRPAFWHDDRAREVVKAHLRLAANVPTVLIVGGGDGVGGVAPIARAIAAAASAKPTKPAHNSAATLPARPAAQIIVICGKNKRLQAELNAARFGVPVVVCGFVKNMSEYMAASDILVSKAGPGTIAEALIRGLPIVLSGFLPGQEAPNVDYVTSNGVGAFSRDPPVIAEIVLKWLADPTGLAARAKRAKKLGRPDATYQIVREIATLAPKLVETNAVGA